MRNETPPPPPKKKKKKKKNMLALCCQRKLSFESKLTGISQRPKKKKKR